MLTSFDKQPINIAILDISAQNKAVLEYFFSESGKSCFTEVSVDKASAFIIDYDSPGAKESWESTYKNTQKPGIIISIKAVDLPSTLWVAKPLTVKALMEAGTLLKEMIGVESVTAPAITKLDFVETEIDTEVNTKEELFSTALLSTEAPEESLALTVDEISEETIKKDNTEENAKPDHAELALTETKQSEEKSEIDSLLDSLISDGENTEKVESIPTGFTEGNNQPTVQSDTLSDIKSDVESDIQSDIKNNLQSNEKKSITLLKEETATDDLETALAALDTTDNIDDAAIDRILNSTNKASDRKNKKNKKKNTKKTAEEELQSLLEEIRHEVDGSPISSPSASIPSAEDSDTKIIPEKYATEDAEDNNERYTLTCGNTNDTTNLKSLCAYNPSNHLLSSLLQNITRTKETKEFLQMKFNGIILVIDPASERIFCDQDVTTEFFASVCHEPMDHDKTKVHKLDESEIRLYNKKMSSENNYMHSVEAFVWTVSLLTSRGRLPQSTPLKARVQLMRLPNFAQLENTPYIAQIAELFKNPKGDLSDILLNSKLPQKYIVAFYNAALAVDVFDGVKIHIPSQSTLGEKQTNKKQGLFSKLINKVTA